MTEEVSGAPKPEGSITPLPKVLVQQASEDKSEGTIGNDGSITITGAETTKVNGDVHHTETPDITPQTGTESIKSNDKHENSGAHEATDTEVKNSQSMQSQEETAQPEVQTDGMATKVLTTETAIGNNIPSVKDTSPNIKGNVGEIQTSEETAKPNNVSVLSVTPNENSAPERPRSKTPDEWKGSERQEQEVDSNNSEAQSERPRSKTPSETDIATSLEKPVNGDNNEEDLGITEKKEQDDRPGSKTRDAHTRSESSAHEMGQDKTPTPQKSPTPSIRSEGREAQPKSPTPSAKSEERAVLPKSPTPSARSEDKASVRKSPTLSSKSGGEGEQSPTPGKRSVTPITSTENEEVQQRNLLEMVVNESPADSGRKTPGSYSDDPDHQENGNDEERKKTASAAQAATIEQSRGYSASPEVNADDKAEASSSKAFEKIPSLDEGGSVTSEERTVVENAYDASVSGNEEDGPASSQLQGEAETLSSEVYAPEPEEAKVTSSPSIEEPGKATPVESVPEDTAADADKILATPTMPSPQRSPKMVKFAPSPGNFTNSSLAPPGNENEYDDASEQHNSRHSVMTPDVQITLDDLREADGNEPPPSPVIGIIESRMRLCGH